MDFGVLGPVMATPLEPQLNASRKREWRILAALLMEPNELVPVERLAEALWDASPPRTFREQLFNCGGRLRRTIHANGEALRLTSTSNGFMLLIDEDQIDQVRFGRLFRDAERAAILTDRPRAVDLYGQAIGLWRGSVLDGAVPEYLVPSASRLDEMRNHAIEQWLGLRLELDPISTVPDIVAFVADNPLRERAVALLMRGLCSAGRSSEALGCYTALRSRLVRELAIEPSAEIQQLRAKIVRGQIELLPPVASALRAEATDSDLRAAFQHLERAQSELRRAAVALGGTGRLE